MQIDKGYEILGTLKFTCSTVWPIGGNFYDI